MRGLPAGNHFRQSVSARLRAHLNISSTRIDHSARCACSSLAEVGPFKESQRPDVGWDVSSTKMAGNVNLAREDARFHDLFDPQRGR